jgi:hypothetical protein
VTASLPAASWRVVRRSGLLVPVAAACAVIAATAHLFDDGYAAQVLRGVGVLLACAWVCSLDDPMGEVAAGSAYPRSVRSAARAAVALAVLGPLWVGTALVGAWRTEELPLLPLALEAAVLGLAGIAGAAGLRAWGDRHQPSYLVVPALVALAVGINSLPRAWAMVPFQTWGPPWEAAQVRWTALALLCVGVLVAALRDPMVRPPARSWRLRPDRHDPWRRGTSTVDRETAGCTRSVPA